MNFKENYEASNIANGLGPKGRLCIYTHKGGEFDPASKTVIDGELISYFEDHNLIAVNASLLIARHLYPAAESVDPLNYLALGTGVGTGTQQEPQAADPTLTQLRVELARKAFTSYSYLDASGNTVVGPTARIQITTTLLEADANGAITEMGLFGGTATSTANSGYMFNMVTFPVINKDNTIRITVVWDITF